MEAIYVFDSRAGSSFVYTGPSLLSPGTELAASGMAHCNASWETCQDVMFIASGLLVFTAHDPDQTVTNYYQFSQNSLSTPGTYNSRRLGRDRNGDTS
jgi:hypothetical protein